MSWSIAAGGPECGASAQEPRRRHQGRRRRLAGWGLAHRRGFLAAEREGSSRTRHSLSVGLGRVWCRGGCAGRIGIHPCPVGTPPRGPAARLVAFHKCIANLFDRVGHDQQIQVLGETAPGRPASSRPSRAVHSSTAESYRMIGNLLIFRVCTRVKRFEHLIKSAEPAGEDHEALGIFHEHGLPHEEVAEVDRQIEVRDW